MSEKKALCLIFAAAVAVRLAFFFIAYHASGSIEATIFAGDGYHDIAESILAGHGFSQNVPPYAPEIVRMPLYPLLIAGMLFVFHSYWLVAIFQLLIASFLPVLAYRIVQELLGDTRIALVTAGILVIEPIFILNSFLLLTETLGTFFFFASLLYFLRYMRSGTIRLLAASSASFALATLTRPTTAYLPILLIPLLAWLHQRNFAIRLKNITIFFGTFMLLIAPWIARNQVVLHAAVLTEQDVLQFYTTFMPSVIALEKNEPFETAQVNFLSSVAVDNLNYNTLSPVRLKALSDERVSFIRARAKGALMASLLSFATFFTQDGYLNFLDKLGFSSGVTFRGSSLLLVIHSPGAAFALMRGLIMSPGILIIIGRLFWLAVLLLFAFGLYRLYRKQHTKAAALATLIVGYFALTACLIGFGVSARYRMPVDPLLIGVALYAVFKQRPERNHAVLEP